MLRVNLNMLLAERDLTASRLSKDTGISKTTLTSLVNNTGKGVQYDTVDTICNYLNVTPNEFFDYIPVDYVFEYESFNIDLVGDSEVSVDGMMFSLEDVNHSFRFYIDIKTKRKNKAFNFEGTINIPDSDKPFFLLIPFSINLEFKDDDYSEFDELFYKKLSKGHQTIFNNYARDFILSHFKDIYNEAIQQHDTIITELDFDNVLIFLPWDLPF